MKSCYIHIRWEMTTQNIGNTKRDIRAKKQDIQVQKQDIQEKNSILKYLMLLVKKQGRFIFERSADVVKERKDLIIAFANLLYKGIVDSKDRKLLWKTFRKNK